ncbi:MAG: shikimate kinase [Pseudomonadota bacterium]
MGRFDKNLTSAARDRLDGRTVVLVGLMGCGKSTVGRRLATALGLPFRDADQEIEIAAGKTIPEIFEDHGEAYFRDGERRVIQRLLSGGQSVLATGGGAFINDETRAFIAEQAVSIWLKAELGVLVKRVGKRDNRPLLKGGDHRTILQDLMDVREPIYATADLVVPSHDTTHEAVVVSILEALRDQSRPRTMISNALPHPTDKATGATGQATDAIE